MRFNEVWANTLYANSVLKITSTVLGLTTIILAFAIIRLGLRDPLLIERACFSKVLNVSKTPHTSEEVEALARIAVERRFNSDADDVISFIDSRELLNRAKEQEEFKAKSIFQKIVVNSVKVDGTKVLVDADRILGSGKVKSVLAFPLQVELVESDRTPSNPYGLMLGKVSPIKEAK